MNSKLTDPSTAAPCAATAKPTDPAANHTSSRRLQLVWSIKRESAAVIRVAFASTDRVRVDQHFGAAEGFAIYDVTPGKATLVGIAEFAREAMDGNEDKLAAKIDCLSGCAAVYVLAIGASAIKQLTARGIQPVRINEAATLEDLLRDLSTAIGKGGVAWVDRAIAAQARAQSVDRFAAMEQEGWEG